METNKDKQLQRRVQSLQRFLMTRLKAELAQRAPAQQSDQSKPALGAADHTDAGSSCHPALAGLQISCLPRPCCLHILMHPVQ